MIAKAALGIALALALALSWALWSRSSLKADNATLRASLDASMAALNQREEAAAVLRAHVERLEQSNRERGERLRELQQLEGRDAPLSDHLRDAAGILWP